MRLFLILLAICALPATAAEPTDVWIDTDMAFGLFLRDMDDGFAVARAIRSKRLNVVGISTSFGNASERSARKITRNLLAKAELSIPVTQGAKTPRDFSRSMEAVDALAAVLRQTRLTVVMLGPLTTLAALLEQHPESAGRIDRVIALAGRRPGYHPSLRGCFYPFSDANYRKDPQAVLRVLRSGIPVRLVPWETASRVRLERSAVVAERHSDPLGRWLERESRSWFRAWRVLGAQRHPPAFDTALILAAEYPGLFEWTRCRIVVSGSVERASPFRAGSHTPHYLLASPEIDSPLVAEVASLPGDCDYRITASRRARAGEVR